MCNTIFTDYSTYTPTYHPNALPPPGYQAHVEDGVVTFVAPDNSVFRIPFKTLARMWKQIKLRHQRASWVDPGVA